MANVLIIDDDVQLCKALRLAITEMGHHVRTAHFLSQGVETAQAYPVDVIILDLRLPDGNGLDVIPTLRQAPSAPEIIILSGVGDPDGAELAIRNGAWSYVSKPPTLNNIKLPVSRAIEYRRQKRSRSATTLLKRDSIIGSSRAMESCLDLAAQAAFSEANVLVCGDTGTGKELVARAIHDNSRRAQGPFVVVDCAALPENLVESVLFGHTKGAFTSADKSSVGLVSQAAGGTLFLDEIGELPLSVQKSFLRVLQERRFRPVGSTKESESDFRLICATNRDLDQMVAAFDFRQDLLFRVRTLQVEVPLLKDRDRDVEELALFFAARSRGMPVEISKECLDALHDYDWPGNVRELEHAMESAVAEAGGESVLLPRHLPMAIRIYMARSNTGPQHEEQPLALPTLKEFRDNAMQELEAQYMRDLLVVYDGSVENACSISGLSRARFYALLKKYGLKRSE